LGERVFADATHLLVFVLLEAVELWKLGADAHKASSPLMYLAACAPSHVRIVNAVIPSTSAST
jgi:hypothetical protein